MNEQLALLTNDAEKELADIYAELDAVSMKNTEKILDAFRRNRVSEAIFAPTSGYGYVYYDAANES